jgi:carbonic anhydrase/acetyltransferase-like protein (isoleucine patch superfamily)
VKYVELAAVVVVPDNKNLAAIYEPQPALRSSGISRPVSSSLPPILGNDVLLTWTDRVHKFGINSLWITSSPTEGCEADPGLGRLLRQGIERLLMIKLKSYAEMDLADLIRFHCQRQNSMTEVHDSRGQLGVSVLDRDRVPADGQRCESLGVRTNFEPATYPFQGYAKRILSSSERQELVGDALTAACAMRPRGTEIRDQMWIGEGVSLASSARVIGPTYIGDRSIVRAGATIGPFASVECDCVVDCGTTLERSTVLPCTYLAPGLLIRHALVDGGHLEDLSSCTVVDLQLGGLATRMPKRQASATGSVEAATDAFSQTPNNRFRSVPSIAEWHTFES